MSSQKVTIQAIVETLLNAPAAERDTLLWEACGEDDDLRSAVTAQLTASIKGNEARIDLGEGDRVGGYRILDVLGEGGMGTVFLAEQREPVLRQVALKVVKLGMDTQDVLARFDAERQALAMMSHPNVAAVLDAGATETGRPYFAMEYVAGLPITDYCDRNRLSISERVDLFRQACRGVEHAHQRGIIHRDLKPGNILVTNKDGQPLVKIIDFGIAKSTQQRLTANTLYTQLGVFIGTPDYTSPEQASKDATDIDTRTDVYSLGVVLYELVVGVPPYGRAMFTGKELPEIVRIIRDSEPPTPSDRFAKLGGMNQAIAKNRSAAIDHVLKRLKSDLAAILHMAMKKDRNGRYDSVSTLRRDLEQFLAGAPVQARPLTRWYRFSRFVFRHRAAVAAVTLIIALLAGAATVSTVQFFRARQAAEVAVQAAEVAQRGQSKYLALLTNQAIDEWQADKALLLALNALPGAYGGDRPLVPEAQVALNRAVNHARSSTVMQIEFKPASALLSPSTELLAVSPEDDTMVDVISVAQKRRLFRAEHDDQVLQAAFSPDGKHLATLGHDGLRLWNARTGDRLWHASVTDQLESDVQDDDQSVASIFESLQRSMVNLPQLTNVARGDWRTRPLASFSPDGKLIAYAPNVGGVTICRVADGEVLHSWSGNMRMAYFSADGSSVMVVDDSQDQLLAINVSTGRPRTVNDDIEINFALPGAAGRQLVAVLERGIMLYGENGNEPRELQSPYSTESRFSEEIWEQATYQMAIRSIVLGTELVVGGTEFGTLVWGKDALPLEQLRGKKVLAVALSPDEQYVAAGAGLGQVWIWGTESFGNPALRIETIELPAHPAPVIFVGFNQDGSELVSLSTDGTLVFRQATSVKRPLDGWSAEDADEVTLSSDGRFLSAYQETTSSLQLWHAADGSRAGTIDSQMVVPRGDSFHPTEPWLVTSDPFTHRLGQAQSGGEIWSIDNAQRLAGTGARQTDVDLSVFTQGGERIITADLGSPPSVTIWDAQRGMILQFLDGERFLASSAAAPKLLTRSGPLLKMHDLQEGTTIERLVPEPASSLERAAFSADGSHYLLVRGDQVEHHAVDAGAANYPIQLTSEPSHFGISKDGRRWFMVVQDTLYVRESGVVVDAIPVDPNNRGYAITEHNIVTVSAQGMVTLLDIPESVNVKDGVALLSAERRCLSRLERAEYDLEPLSDEEWQARGCPQNSADSRNQVAAD